MIVTVDLKLVWFILLGWSVFCALFSIAAYPYGSLKKQFGFVFLMIVFGPLLPAILTLTLVKLTNDVWVRIARPK
jgi:hypothetical protein